MYPCICSQPRPSTEQISLIVDDQRWVEQRREAPTAAEALVYRQEQKGAWYDASNMETWSRPVRGLDVDRVWLVAGRVGGSEESG